MFSCFLILGPCTLNKGVCGSHGNCRDSAADVYGTNRTFVCRCRRGFSGETCNNTRKFLLLQRMNGKVVILYAGGNSAIQNVVNLLWVDGSGECCEFVVHI